MKEKIRSLIRIIQYWYYRLIGYYPAKIYGYNFKLNYENFIFWRDVSKNVWEPNTYDILTKFLNANSVYFDIGSWIGPTVIYGAKRCKKVICFEPDPIAFKALLLNVYSNNLYNVHPYNVAISSQTGIRQMSSFGVTIGDSMTSLLSNQNKSSSKIDALVLDWNFIENVFKQEKIGMIKIDIEGGEFSLIPAMATYLKKHKPIVWLSLHVPFLEESDRAGEMQNIISVLSCYRTCRNSHLEIININELASEENLNGFPSFLFVD